MCCMEKHTHFWIDRKGAYAAAKEIVGTNLHFTDSAKVDEFLGDNFEAEWKKVDGKGEWNSKKRQTKFVVVSSISAAPDHGGSETFIFPSDAKGVVQNWGELQGSQRGNASAFLVLGSLGYTLK